MTACTDCSLHSFLDILITDLCNLFIFIYSHIYCVCLCAHVCVSVWIHTYVGFKRQVGTQFSCPPLGFQELNSGSKVWGQEFLSAESWSQPHKYVFLKPIIYFWCNNQGTHATALIIKFKLKPYFLKSKYPLITFSSSFFFWCGIWFALYHVCVVCMCTPMTKTVSPQGRSVFASTDLKMRCTHHLLHGIWAPHDHKPLHWFLQKTMTLSHIYKIQALPVI